LLPVTVVVDTSNSRFLFGLHHGHHFFIILVRLLLFGIDATRVV